MYNFVFWFFYKFFEWRKGFKSFFLPAGMVGLAVLIHLGLAYSIVRYFTGFTVEFLSSSYGYNRLILLPIILFFFFCLYQLYYKKNAERILEKRRIDNFSQPRNILLIILVLVLPLLVSIRLTNIAVKGS